MKPGLNSLASASSGNLAVDMYANVEAESTGRALATRLYEITDDAGIKDMLSFLIACDPTHQNEWLAVLEELDEGKAVNVHSTHDSFPQSKEAQDMNLNYAFITTNIDAEPSAGDNRGSSIDSKGRFS